VSKGSLCEPASTTVSDSTVVGQVIARRSLDALLALDRLSYIQALPKRCEKAATLFLADNAKNVFKLN
jgi:hypothetical protein